MLKVHSRETRHLLSELPADGKITADEPQLSAIVDRAQKNALECQGWGDQLSSGQSGRCDLGLKLKLRKNCFPG